MKKTVTPERAKPLSGVHPSTVTAEAVPLPRWIPDSRCAAPGMTSGGSEEDRHPGKGEALVRGPFLRLHGRRRAATQSSISPTEKPVKLSACPACSSGGSSARPHWTIRLRRGRGEAFGGLPCSTPG